VVVQRVRLEKRWRLEMDNNDRDQLLDELKQFRVIRSLEIARGNIDRLELVTKSAHLEMKIRELTLARERADAPVTDSFP
jgi:hypothetical protein